jgi:hypothetical protein
MKLATRHAAAATQPSSLCAAPTRLQDSSSNSANSMRSTVNLIVIYLQAHQQT